MDDVKCCKCGKSVSQKIVLGCYEHPHFATDERKETRGEIEAKVEIKRLRTALQSIIDDVPRAIEVRALQTFVKRIKDTAQKALEGDK